VTTLDTLELRAKYSGDADMIRLLDQYDQLNQKAAGLNQQLKVGSVTLDDYARNMRDVRSAQAALGGAIDGLAGPQGKVRNLGAALNQASYGLQDFLANTGSFGSKLNGAANNLAPLVMALGGPVGLVAVLGLAGTAIAAFWPQIEKMIGASGGATDAVGKLREALEKLTTNPYEVAVDTGQIDALQAKLKDIEDAQKKGAAPGTASEAVGSAGSMAMRGIAEFGGETENRSGKDNLRMAMEASAKQSPQFQAAMQAYHDADAAYKDAQQRLQLGQTDPATVAGLRGERDRAQAKMTELDNTIRSSQERTLGRIEQGDESQMKKLMTRMRFNRDIFEERGVNVDALTSSLATAMPSERRRAKALEEEARRAEAITQQRDERLAQEKAAADAKVDMLNEHGAQNERDSNAAEQRRQQQERKNEQDNKERERQSKQGETELEQKANDASNVLGPWAAAQIAARQGTRDQLMSKGMQAGLNQRQAAQQADRQMRGAGFLSDEQIQQTVAQRLIQSGQVQGPEEASGVAAKIVGQANDQVRDTFAQAEQAFATRDEAIIATMQRMIGNAQNATEQIRNLNQGANGGRRVPPMMRRNGP
jgi:colicin import membrane protein